MHLCQTTGLLQLWLDQELTVSWCPSQLPRSAVACAMVLLPLPLAPLLLLLPLLLLPLVVGREGSGCAEALMKFIPHVTPVNSSHLVVSWSSLLHLCSMEETNFTFLLINSITQVDFLQGEAHVKLNPCMKHNVLLAVKMESKVTESQVNYYNSFIPGSPGLLYSGLLGTAILKDTCLVTASTIKVPPPPGALDHCVKTRGEQQLSQPAKEGGRVNVSLTILDPEDQGLGILYKTFVAKIVAIKKCPQPTSDDKTSSSSSWALLAAALLVVVTSLAIIGAVVVLVRHRCRSEDSTSKCYLVEHDDTLGWTEYEKEEEENGHELFGPLDIVQ